MHPHPMTSVMQLSITGASLCVAAAAIIFAVKSMSEERNARLVEIGVGVLRVDPQKEQQVAGARRWALDLIEANAGGVKFSADAKKELLSRRLDIGQPIDWGQDIDWSKGTASGGDGVGPADTPPRPRKPPKSN